MQQSSMTLRHYCLVDISAGILHFGAQWAIFENHIFLDGYYRFLAANVFLLKHILSEKALLRYNKEDYTTTMGQCWKKLAKFEKKK